MILSILNNLHKELSTFLISIVISIIIIVISNSWWQTSYDEKTMAQSTLIQAKDRYYTALDQKKLLEKFEEKYDQLKSSGIVGEENRLNWVDSIENITSSNKIPYIKYSIAKRIALNSPQIAQNFPGITLYKSAMTLEMQLLHEGDLYTVLNSLEKMAKGLFDIQNCTIIRNSTQVESLIDSQTNKNFSSKCELNWYTMQTKTAALPVRR